MTSASGTPPSASSASRATVSKKAAPTPRIAKWHQGGAEDRTTKDGEATPAGAVNPSASAGRLTKTRLW
jgi:hypothetical protein